MFGRSKLLTKTRASPQLEALDDVGARQRVGGGGEGDARHAGIALGQHRELQVVLAEVVAPLADAVRLVDGEHRKRPRSCSESSCASMRGVAMRSGAA